MQKCPQCGSSKYVKRSIKAGHRICRRCFVKFDLKGRLVKPGPWELKHDRLV
jgi:ribosomal protein L37AE/L43A